MLQMNNSMALQEGKTVTHQVSYNDTGQRLPGFGEPSPRLADSAMGFGDVLQNRAQHPMSPSHRKSLTSLHHSETEVRVIVIMWYAKCTYCIFRIKREELISMLNCGKLPMRVLKSCFYFFIAVYYILQFLCSCNLIQNDRITELSACIKKGIYSKCHTKILK